MRFFITDMCDANGQSVRQALILWSAAVLIAALPFHASADSGGPDTFGYLFIDSNEPGGPAFNFEDISGTGTPVSLSDDRMSGANPIGFTFEYYGINYTSAYISSNGFISFLAAQSHGCCSGRPIPSFGNPDAIIAGWWEDLCPPCSGGSPLYPVQPPRTNASNQG